MKVITRPCGILQANMYVIYDDYNDAIVIDPIDADVLFEILDSASLSLKAVFLTHAHFDHASALGTVTERYGVPSYIHFADADSLSDPRKNASLLIGSSLDLGLCSDTVKDGDTVTCGSITVTVHHTPGHSQGSVCYEIDGMLFSGDTLFRGGIGRLDLYGGDAGAMSKSLQTLAGFTKNLTVYPGHGAATSLYYERKYNPYFEIMKST